MKINACSGKSNWDHSAVLRSSEERAVCKALKICEEAMWKLYRCRGICRVKEYVRIWVLEAGVNKELKVGQRQHVTVWEVRSVPLGCPLIKALHFLLRAGSNQARVVRTAGLLSCSAVWVRCRAARQVPPNSSSKQKFVVVFLSNKQPAHVLFFALLTPVLLIFYTLI